MVELLLFFLAPLILVFFYEAGSFSATYISEIIHICMLQGMSLLYVNISQLSNNYVCDHKIKVKVN